MGETVLHEVWWTTGTVDPDAFEILADVAHALGAHFGDPVAVWQDDDGIKVFASRGTRATDQGQQDGADG